MSAEIIPGAAPQLEYVGFEVDHVGAITVHVRQPGDMSGLTIEQALRRIDEFKKPDRARILRALPDLYDVPVCGACGTLLGACALAQRQAGAQVDPAPASASRARRTKKTNQHKETT